MCSFGDVSFQDATNVPGGTVRRCEHFTAEAGHPHTFQAHGGHPILIFGSPGPVQKKKGVLSFVHPFFEIEIVLFLSSNRIYSVIIYI